MYCTFMQSKLQRIDPVYYRLYYTFISDINSKLLIFIVSKMNHKISNIVIPYTLIDIVQIYRIYIDGYVKE